MSEENKALVVGVRCMNCDTPLYVHEKVMQNYFGVWLYVMPCPKCRPTPLALDGATVCRKISHLYIDGVCAECGSPEPPRQ